MAVNTAKFNWLIAFRDRLAQEGEQRVKDFEDSVTARAIEQGKPRAAAYSQVAKEFGYKSAAEERRLWDVRHQISSRAAEEAERNQLALAETLATLPANASPQKEIDWIRSHPAMTRKAMAGGKASVFLTLDDILKSPNGPAPSQSAVQQLQVWMNDPAAFFKQLASRSNLMAAAAGDVGERYATEKQSIERTMEILGQFSLEAKRITAEAIGLKPAS